MSGTTSQPAERRYRFDLDYEEPVQLRDGSTAWLRLVRPDDKQLIHQAFHHLSKESRYRRFLTDRKELSARDLTYLTEVDGINHFAIGALRRRDAGPDDGLGIARFIRLPDRPEVAEAAVAVIDDMQRKGLGRLLLHRLAAAAKERGIERFYCEVLESNRPIQNLLCDLGLVPLKRLEDGVVSVEIDLTELPDPPPPSAGSTDPGWLPVLLERLLALVAAGAVVVRRAVLRAAPPNGEDGEPSREDAPDTGAPGHPPDSIRDL